eukprot:1433131-Rhodomonas_salina.1
MFLHNLPPVGSFLYHTGGGLFRNITVAYGTLRPVLGERIEPHRNSAASPSESLISLTAPSETAATVSTVADAPTNLRMV